MTDPAVPTKKSSGLTLEGGKLLPLEGGQDDSMYVDGSGGKLPVYAVPPPDTLLKALEGVHLPTVPDPKGEEEPTVRAIPEDSVSMAGDVEALYTRVMELEEKNQSQADKITQLEIQVAEQGKSLTAVATSSQAVLLELKRLRDVEKSISTVERKEASEQAASADLSRAADATAGNGGEGPGVSLDQARDALALAANKAAGEGAPVTLRRRKVGV